MILCDPFLYESGDLLADAPSLFALHTLEQLSFRKNKLFTTIEFIYERNMRVIGKEDYALGPTAEVFEDFGAASMPSFIGGHAFSHSILHSILTQTYYKYVLLPLTLTTSRHLLHICRRLIYQGDSEPVSADDCQSGTPETNSASIKSRGGELEDHGLLYQIPLPQEFIAALEAESPESIKKKAGGRSIFQRLFGTDADEEQRESSRVCYSHLFRYLLKKENTLPMGLYRKREGKRQVIRYTVVNPPSNLRLRKDDLVFILSSKGK